MARTIGAEWVRGSFTYLARYDVALVLDLFWRIGASLTQPRVADMLRFVAGLQGPIGTYSIMAQQTKWTDQGFRTASHSHSHLTALKTLI